MDWLSELDLGLALQNCHNDVLGDWYRDPWSWPELDWVVHQRPELVVARLNSTGARRVARLDVAKENFGIRPAIVMDPIDRLAYQALVDSLSRQLVGSIPGWVHGWRLPARVKKPGEYARNDRQWLSFVHEVKNNSTGARSLLKTDIISFFSSVPIGALVTRLNEISADPAIIGRLCDMLRSWDRIPIRGGLPQRSAASAVLANMYLSPIDELLQHYADGLRGQEIKCARWMDDIWLFGSSESSLRGIQVELQNSLREIGLELNLAKTNVFAKRGIKDEVDKLDLTGLDYLLNLQPPSPQGRRDFDALINEITADPVHASRTTIRFATTRMRTHELYEAMPIIVDNAARMPQGADSLARLFRDSGEWRNLFDWYLDYALGPWGKLDWSVAQFGTMFPVSHPAPIGIEEFFASLLKMSSLALVALGAQRLVAWDSPDVRYLLREAAVESDNPMQRRVLALAALQAGESRLTIRRMLSEFEENSVTLEMLEDRGFRKPRLVADFLGETAKRK